MAQVIENVRVRLKLPECNPSAQTLNAIFSFDGSIAEILPYLNTVLKGFQYNDKEKILVIKRLGRLITIREKEIAITKVKDEKEAYEIFDELRDTIKEVFQSKSKIVPSYTTPKLPSANEILDFLPKKDCKECGKRSCRVFAWDVYLRFINGEPLALERCPHLLSEDEKDNYLRLKTILFEEG